MKNRIIFSLPLSFLLIFSFVLDDKIFAQTPIGSEVLFFIDTDKSTYNRGETINISTGVPGFSEAEISISIIDFSGAKLFTDTVATDYLGIGAIQYTIPECTTVNSLQIIGSVTVNNQLYEESTNLIIFDKAPKDCEVEWIEPPPDKLGEEKQVDDTTVEPAKEIPIEPVEKIDEEKPSDVSPQENGGGCLIATATFNSELSPVVQDLRELRDNTLLATNSGKSFMNSFNTFYYSFSPTIADWERQNSLFKEIVKISLTPLISSLSLLNYVEIDSEVEMLFYGNLIILLNIGIYFVSPALLITTIKKKKIFQKVF